MAQHLQPEVSPDYNIPPATWERHAVRGALYMVIRNENLQDARAAMRSVEDRFNKHYQYPWILLNNQDFSPTFRKFIRKVTDAPIFFGKTDMAAWDYPSWIDIPLAENKMLDMTFRTALHMGGSLSFRKMLRYQSGLFIHHPLFRDVDYVWRVEPGAEYSCDMEFDPFQSMKDNNKTLANETVMPWITDEMRSEYNMCHIWSNFEIVETSFLRSKAYQEYFSYLDRKGGFFYERWGDAPVRTLAAAMFLPRSKLQFFDRIGYSHSVATHCPVNPIFNQKCSCDKFGTYDLHPDSCTSDLLRYIDQATHDEMISFAKYVAQEKAQQ
ncbi:nucleotide-diphospho-sugar transferase [Lichtheimia hyalospora FSU 10163]|nr:nucleotide-diphospho-sugar transferase [Lichtheimia hyalospora FSU 10163]